MLWDTVFGLFRGFLFENRPRKTGTKQGGAFKKFVLPPPFRVKVFPFWRSMSFKRVVQQSPIVTCIEPTLQLTWNFEDSNVLRTPSHGGFSMGFENQWFSGFQLGDFLGMCFFFIGKCPITWCPGWKRHPDSCTDSLCSLDSHGDMGAARREALPGSPSKTVSQHGKVMLQCYCKWSASCRCTSYFIWDV